MIFDTRYLTTSSKNPVIEFFMSTGFSWVSCSVHVQSFKITPTDSISDFLKLLTRFSISKGQLWEEKKHQRVFNFCHAGLLHTKIISDKIGFGLPARLLFWEEITYSYSLLISVYYIVTEILPFT